MSNIIEEGINTLNTLTASQLLVIVILLAIVGKHIYSQKDKIVNFLEQYRLRRNEIDARNQAQRDVLEKVNLLEKNQHELHHQVVSYVTKTNENFVTLSNQIAALSKKVEDMDALNNRAKCNELRDRLLQLYRYYTGDRNPTNSWTEMEAEAFWSLFDSYEELGGDGYMHETVQPAMQELEIHKI